MNSPVLESEYLTERTKRIRQTVKGTFGKMWKGLLKVHKLQVNSAQIKPKKARSTLQKNVDLKRSSLKGKRTF